MVSKLAASFAALTFVAALAASPRAHAQEPSASARATARSLMDEGWNRRDKGEAWLRWARRGRCGPAPIC